MIVINILRLAFIIVFTIAFIDIIYIKTIRFLTKVDAEIDVDFHLMKKVERYVLLVISFLEVYLCYKYKFTITFFAYSYLTLFLSTAATIDYLTHNVYTVLNYITFVISLVFVYLTRGLYINPEIIIFIVLNAFLAIFKIYGGGDSELYIAITPFIMINYNDVLIILLIDMIIANVIMIIANIKNFDFKKFRFKKEIAFVPYIAISTIMILITI